MKTDEISSKIESQMIYSKKEKTKYQIFIHVGMFMFFSSIMLIINKLSIKLLSLPSLLLFIQMFLTTCLIWIFGQFGYIELEKIEWNKIKSYIGVVLLFMINLYSNIKILESSSVETVIVFRTLSSLAIAYGDYKFLKTKLPNIQTLIALSLIVVGSILYAWNDHAFKIDAYFWGIIYVAVKVADTLYTKYVVDNIPMSNWSRSFYNNIISLIPIGIISLSTGEIQKLIEMIKTDKTDVITIIVVLISSILGLGISVSGFICRELVTATSFSVIGNMNKILTIIINCLVMDEHANFYGLCSLFICLLGGMWYAKAAGKNSF